MANRRVLWTLSAPTGERVACIYYERKFQPTVITTWNGRTTSVTEVRSMGEAKREATRMRDGFVTEWATQTPATVNGAHDG